jgi:hypothetical protein
VKLRQERRETRERLQREKAKIYHPKCWEWYGCSDGEAEKSKGYVATSRKRRKIRGGRERPMLLWGTWDGKREREDGRRVTVFSDSTESADGSDGSSDSSYWSSSDSPY